MTSLMTFIAKDYYMGWIYNSFAFIYSPVAGLMGIWVVSRLGLLQESYNDHLGKGFYGHKLSFIIDKCPGVPLPSSIIITHFVFKVTAKLISRMAVQFIIQQCTNDLVSHILVAIWCCHNFSL